MPVKNDADGANSDGELQEQKCIYCDEAISNSEAAECWTEAACDVTSLMALP
jgi:hypothetical protein